MMKKAVLVCFVICFITLESHALSCYECTLSSGCNKNIKEPDVMKRDCENRQYFRGQPKDIPNLPIGELFQNGATPDEDSYATNPDKYGCVTYSVTNTNITQTRRFCTNKADQICSNSNAQSNSESEQITCAVCLDSECNTDNTDTTSGTSTVLSITALTFMVPIVISLMLCAF